MKLLDLAVVLVLVMSVTLFLLGLKSQKGKAKGLENGRLADCGTRPNCVCSEDGTQPERAVAPLSTTLERAKQAVINAGGTITAETDSYVSATFMSSLFKFVDDVELRADGDVVHIRSASRVGYSDRGVNRKRVEEIRDRLA